MTPWLESAGVVALAVSGTLAGSWFSRQTPALWCLGYVLAFAPILLIAVLKRVQTLSFAAPFSWLVAGCNEFALTAFFAAMVLSVLAPRLGRPRDRRAVRGVVVGFTIFCVLPFSLPALLEGSLSGAPTNVDPDGVCLQGRSYTCGPAAAVTALRLLGLSASEGELAVLAGTTPVSGTQPDTLRDALRRRYGRDGLRGVYRTFESVDALQDAGVVITVINFSLLVDHYVTVLAVDRDSVRLGDPLEGVREMRRGEFERIWRRVGIALERGGSAKVRASPTATSE